MQAKRPPPKIVQTVHGSRIYRANQWTGAADPNGGVVQVLDRKTEKLLWSIRVYCIEKKPDLEGDVQDVFITSLDIRGQTLTVTNERTDVFEVDLKTRRISVVKAGSGYSPCPPPSPDGSR